ncbi:MFS transporter [Flavobacterium silvaticum]|uniref:SLC45 family MFS transporter n=1 Tax=Flavobacterium silvaticum TaxID=1852020 RepID=A0A972FSF5_9FLAO|nr:MFS transporter [Flavobacterium silvaticum]NMH27157.1 SLC45 family MFS transporter [Flavobacterium silvaticum]
MEKRRLSFWEIWNMSFGFLGIQFGFELQNSNISRIFETLGANKDEIPILWIAAPFTGLVVQPIIGYLSDRTWHHYWGRRRPFFFMGAVLASIALFIVPNSPTLWIAGGMLWILDASINISMEPFRAFVGDKLPPEQRTSGFAMQSFFIGIGSVIAAILPWVFTNWLHFSNTAPAGEIPESVKWSFYVGGFAFLSAVMYTVFTTKEFPPESIEALRKERKETTFSQALKETFGGIFKMPKTMKQLAFVQFFTWFALFSMWIYATNAVTSTKYNMHISPELFAKAESFAKEKKADNIKDSKQLKSLQKDFEEIRKFGNLSNPVISVNIANYFADGNFKEFTQSKAEFKRVQQEYNDGADWLNVCSSVRNGVAALFAFIIPLIAFRTNRKITHAICLVIGGLGLLSIYFITNPTLIVVSMGMVGVAWASILSMPYAMLSNALPANKMGYYMGVFNFFIVIPQIVAASILGYFTIHIFNADTLLTIVLGGCSMILAAALTLIVKDDGDNKKTV